MALGCTCSSNCCRAGFYFTLKLTEGYLDAVWQYEMDEDRKAVSPK